MAHVEIYPGSKLVHFEKLRDATGLDYGDMVFFDDSADGKYGNCAPVAKLGVLSAHCPRGLTTDIWRNTLSTYAERRASGSPTGMVLRPDGARSDLGGSNGGSLPGGGGDLVPATVAKYFDDKGFGFVTLTDGAGARDVFFHRSKATGLTGGIRPGARVSVKVARDGRGRLECTAVNLEGGESATRSGSGGSDTSGGGGGGSVDGIVLPTFSMNMPFAGLVAHGIKDLETRNHTMFEGTEGRLALLHVGMRTYPDGGKHRTILSRGVEGGAPPLDDEAIDRFTSLPEGFRRGQVVAVLELGETRLASLEERSTTPVERGACAYGSDMGRYLTEVRRTAWLKEPVPMRGKPGLFKAEVPRSAIPSGWALPD